MSESNSFCLGNITFPLSKHNSLLFKELTQLLTESKLSERLVLTSLQMHRYADFVALMEKRSKIRIRNGTGSTQYILEEPDFQEHEYPATVQAFIEWVEAQDKTAREERHKTAVDNMKLVVASAFVGAIASPLANGLIELAKYIMEIL